MNSICIPVPALARGSVVDLDVAISGKTRQMRYRLEMFDRTADDEAETSEVERLRGFIRNYDPAWELVQIGAPEGRYVSLLFRHVNRRPEPAAG